MKKKNSVLIIVQNLPVPFDRRVWLEAKTLRKNGLHVSVICPKSKEHNKSFEVIDDIAVYRYAMPINAKGTFDYFLEFAYAWLATAFLSVKVLTEQGFDVIQACNPPDTYWLLAKIYKLFGKRYIFDHHDLSPEMYAAKYEKKNGFLHKLLLWLEKQTFQTADLVMSTNQSYKEVAYRRGHKNPWDVYVLRTGPDLDRLKIMPQEKKLRNGKNFMVCYLGEMCPQDGVDVLLESIYFYVNGLGRRDTQFTLVGGGPAMPEMQRLSKQMGLQDYVDFTGRVSDEDLCRYLSNADVCVDPDPWSEWADHSTMNKVLEYMTFGKPIVSYDLTETRRSAEKAAVYVKDNDIEVFSQSVSDLLDDPEKRKAMGVYGYKRIRSQLSWEHTHRALLLAYNRVFPQLLTPEEVASESLDLILSHLQPDYEEKPVPQPVHIDFNPMEIPAPLQAHG